MPKSGIPVAGRATTASGSGSGSGPGSEGIIATAAAELIDDAEALIAGEPLEAAEALADAGAASKAGIRATETGEPPSL